MGGIIKILNRKKISYALPLLLIALFVTLYSLLHTEAVTYQFDSSLINRYLRSQDIPHDVPGRLFLSDSDIHISSGYLYVNGYEPTAYNFQHPPLIKYLYGISTLLTGNPFIIQILLALTLLLLTYLVGTLFFKSALTGFIAGLFLLSDPLFHHVSSQALLDLGQCVFITAYAIIAIKFPRLVILQGLLLGLAAVSKFFYPVLVVWFFVQLFNWRKNKTLNIRDNAIVFTCALIILYIVYSLTVYEKGLFSPVFYQLKMLKYWLHHSVSSYPGANLLLFLAGFYKPWWGDKQIEMSNIWSLLWPVTLGNAFIKIYSAYKKHKWVDHLFVFVFPVFYLLTLAVQAPFVRYFIILLPWLYTGFAWSILGYIHKLPLFKKPVV